MLWLLAILPAAAGGTIWAAGIRSRIWLGTLSCAVLAVTLALAVTAADAGAGAAVSWSRTLVLTAGLTRLSATVAMVVPAIAFAVLAYAAAHEERPGLSRLVGLLLVFVGGMELLVVAADLFTLLIGWELVGACSWALIGHRWRDRDNGRSATYAFLATRLGDLGLFIAAMAAFAGTGSFTFAKLAELEGPYLTLVAFGILIAAAAKSGQVPFSPWLFRAMAGPTSVSALLHAATMVAAGAYLVARLAPELDRAAGFGAAVVAIGLITALAGGTVALFQNHAKKLSAASTSAHYGLMFVAAGAGYPGVAVLHLTAHAAFKALMFLSAGIAGDAVGSYELHRMGLGRALPFMAACSAIGALALAGVPPLGGGWTKEAIVTAAGRESLWIAVGAMLAGGLSAAYATRFFLLTYGFRKHGAVAQTPRAAEYLGVVLLVAATLALGVLWLPSVRDSVSGLLGIEIPPSRLTEMAASLALLALGVALGWRLARRQPALGATGEAAAVSDWLGLPSLIEASVVRPFERLARAAARFDDLVLDAGPRTVADDVGLSAGRLARRDRRVVDRGVELAAGLGEWLASIGDRIGERLADGIPEGSAGLVGVGGEEVRRLQSGLSHRYYALLAIGAASMIAVLLIGS